MDLGVKYAKINIITHHGWLQPIAVEGPKGVRLLLGWGQEST